jgi:hypothetical protein
VTALLDGPRQSLHILAGQRHRLLGVFALPAAMVETELWGPGCPTRPTAGGSAPRKERGHCGRDAKRQH